MHKKDVRDRGQQQDKVTINSYPLPLPPFKIRDYYYPPDNGKPKQKVPEKPLILAVFGKSLTSLLN